MNIELEKKFLVKEIPDLTSIGKSKIIQGYLKREDDKKSTIRIRRLDEKAFVTIKIDNGCSGLQEFEYEIPLGDFNEMITEVKDNFVEKTRYYIPLNKFWIELDVFEKNLDGLVVAEVEFNSKIDFDNFVPPEWFGKEVTFDKNFSNASLSMKKFIDLELN